MKASAHKCQLCFGKNLVYQAQPGPTGLTDVGSNTTGIIIIRPQVCTED